MGPRTETFDNRSGEKEVEATGRKGHNQIHSKRSGNVVFTSKKEELRGEKRHLELCSVDGDGEWAGQMEEN